MHFSRKSRRWLRVSSLLWRLSSFIADGQPVSPSQTTLAWTASTDSTIAGFYLYFGGATGVYTNKTDVGTNSIFTVTGLTP
jgi:hypothetical protein